MTHEKETSIILYFTYWINNGGVMSGQQQESINDRAFSGIKTYSNIEVNLISSDVNKIIATGPNSDLIVVSIKDGNLKIRTSRGDIFNQEATKIDLYFNNTLNSISAYQGSKIKSSLRLDQTKLIIVCLNKFENRP